MGERGDSSGIIERSSFTKHDFLQQRRQADHPSVFVLQAMAKKLTEDAFSGIAKILLFVLPPMANMTT